MCVPPFLTVLFVVLFGRGGALGVGCVDITHAQVVSCAVRKVKRSVSERRRRGKGRMSFDGREERVGAWNVS